MLKMAASIAIQSAAVMATTATTVTTSLVVPVVANLVVPIVLIAIPIATSVVSTTCSIIKFGTVKAYSMITAHGPAPITQEEQEQEEKDSPQATT